MTKEEDRLIKAQISDLNDAELVLRRAVRERQSQAFQTCRPVIEIVSKDIEALDKEAERRDLLP